MSRFERDLTEGSVGKQLIKFSLPFLLSNFIQALYSVADTLIVSWYCGPGGVSGVANGGQVSMLVTTLAIGLAIGGTILIGQYFGAKQHDDLLKTIGTMFSILMICAVVLSIVTIALAGPILRMVRIPDEAFQEAKNYLVICMAGTVFIFGYNSISGVLRGMGDSKNPLIFVSIAAVTNVVFDLLLVGPLHMGAAGAAIATVGAQALAMVLSIVYLIRNKFIFDFKWKSFRIDKEKAKLLFKIGLPTSLQQIVVMSSFLVMLTLVNGFGVSASAAMGIVGKFNSFAILPAIAMSASVSSMVAQNFGAGRVDRANETLRSGIKIAFPIGLFFFLIAFFAPRAIMRVFTSDVDVIEQGAVYMRTFCFDYLIVPFAFCCNGLLTGAGHTTFTMITNIASSLAFRVPIALVFGMTLGLGMAGVGLAAPVASVGGLAITLFYLRSGSWRKGKILHAERPLQEPAA